MARDTARSPSDGDVQRGADVDRSTADPGPGGDLALRRIAAPDGDTLPSYDQVLTAILGPIAAQIAPGDVPAEIAAMAHEILEALVAAATAMAVDDHKPAAEADKPAHRAGSSGGAAGRGAGQTATPFVKLRDKLDALIAEKVGEGIALTPKGRALADKFQAFDREHPGLIFEALLLAATATLGRDAKLPELSHTIKLGDAWSVKAGAQLGSIRHIAVSAINASVEYKKGKVDATAGVTRNLDTDNTTFSGQVTFKDLQFLHQTIDQALLSYKHVDQNGKLPTDQIMEQVTFKLQDVGFKLAETSNWGEEKKVRTSTHTTSAGGSGSGKGKGSGSTGASHAPATPAERVLTEKLTEAITLPSWNDYKLTLDGTQNFGRNHAAHSVGARLDLPDIDKTKLSLSATETVGGAGSGGAKLTLPRWNDIGVTLAETVPYGPGHGKPTFSMDIDFKGVTLSIRQGTGSGAGSSPGVGESMGGASKIPEIGAFSSQHGGWTIGVTIPLGGRKK